jgi:hypothetical protein
MSFNVSPFPVTLENGQSVTSERRKQVVVRPWPRAKSIPARHDPRFESWALGQLRLYKPYRILNDLCQPSITDCFTAHLATGGFPFLLNDENAVEERHSEYNSDSLDGIDLLETPSLDARFLQDDYHVLMNITRQAVDSFPLLGTRELDLIHSWPSSWKGWDFASLVSWLVISKDTMEIDPVPVQPLDLASLSDKQRLAFEIIRSHTFGSRQDTQLLMVLVGTAGTGKSFLISAIRSLFDSHGCPDAVKVTAPTGVAASNIFGSTIFSLLSILHTTLTGPRLLNLQLMMQRVRLLIIDEYSFLSASVIDTLDRHLRSIFPQCTQPFGGLNILLSGDPAQLPPVLAQPLYTVSGSSRQNTANFRLFKTVVELDVPFRQTGNDHTQVCFVLYSFFSSITQTRRHSFEICCNAQLTAHRRSKIGRCFRREPQLHSARRRTRLSMPPNTSSRRTMHEIESIMKKWHYFLL